MSKHFILPQCVLGVLLGVAICVAVMCVIIGDPSDMNFRYAGY
jgi:hypothetical protein